MESRLICSDPGIDRSLQVAMFEYRARDGKALSIGIAILCSITTEESEDPIMSFLPAGNSGVARHRSVMIAGLR